VLHGEPAKVAALRVDSPLRDVSDVENELDRAASAVGGFVLESFIR
jgi:hypothetical protein